MKSMDAQALTVLHNSNVRIAQAEVHANDMLYIPSGWLQCQTGFKEECVTALKRVVYLKKKEALVAIKTQIEALTSIVHTFPANRGLALLCGLSDTVAVSQAEEEATPPTV